METFKRLRKRILGTGGVMVESAEEGFACQLFRPNCRKQMYSLCVIASWGGGWDHVSIHAQATEGNFTPFWEDMAYIKALFFKPSETAVQYHPASEHYINVHEHTLHLWRNQGAEILLPPIEFV